MNTPKNDRTKVGRFFAVDLRQIERIGRGGINPVVAYLVLAAGTGRNNAKTTWGIKSVRTYSGMTLRAAKEAVEYLETNGFSKCENPSEYKPGYELLVHPEDRQGRLNSARQEKVYNCILEGRQPESKERNVGKALVNKGLLTEDWSDDGQLLYSIATPKETTEHFVWLPVELITGAKNEDPPIARLRRIGDPWAVLLLLDLYSVEDLSADGGVPRSIVYCEHERRGESFCYGPFSIQSFDQTRGAETACEANIVKKHFDQHASDRAAMFKPFFNRLERLQECGLIYWLPHLVECGPQGQVMHPLRLGNGQGVAGSIGRAAREAAFKLAENDCNRDALESHFSGQYVVPVYRYIDDVQLISIAQLRYRPKTRLNNVRFGEYMAQINEHLDRYKRLAKEGLGETTNDEDTVDGIDELFAEMESCEAAA